MQNQTQTVREFGLRDKIGYMFGDIGNDFFFLLAGSFLMVFYTSVLGVEPGAAGTLFLVARIVDAFTDITMGRIVDRTRPAKEGKFRPWIRRMCLPVVISGTLLFLPWISGLPMWGRMIYIYVTYILWGSFCYTAINIPYGSMASAITADPAQRGALSTFRSIGAALAGVIINVGVPLIIYRYDEAGNQIVIPMNFFALAAVFAVGALVCYLLCYRLTTERIPIQTKAGESRNFGKAVKDMTSNRALLAIVAAAVMLLLAMLFAQSMNVYLFMDYFKNKNAMSAAGFLSTAATLVLAPFSGAIIKKIGKKEASAAAVLFAAGVYAVLYALRLKNPWIFCLFVMFGNLGTGLFNLLIWAFITDIIDYQEVVTGERNDGTIYAVYSFSRKLGQALAGGLGGWLLQAIGYQSSAAGETVVQTEQVLRSIYSVATIAPALCYLAVGMILLLWYPLNRQKVKENTEYLKAKRREQTR